MCLLCYYRMKRERKRRGEKKALGWKIGAGRAERAPGEDCSSRAVRKRLQGLLLGSLERGLKKEKQRTVSMLLGDGDVDQPPAAEDLGLCHAPAPSGC